MNILKKISLLTIVGLALMGNNLHSGNKFRLEAIKAYMTSFKEKSQCAWSIMRNLSADDVRLIMAIAKEQAEEKLDLCRDKMHLEDFVKSFYFQLTLWALVEQEITCGIGEEINFKSLINRIRELVLSAYISFLIHKTIESLVQKEKVV